MTIKQRSRSTPIVSATGPRTIEVRRLQWKAARLFYAELAKILAQLFAAKADPALGSQLSAPDLFGQLPKLVEDSDTLVLLLLTGATDLKADELENLDWGDILALVDSALAVNLDDEIKNSSAGVMAKILGFVGSTKTSSGAGSMPT